MDYILNDSLEIFDRHSGWILWNLFLAYIPFVLSFWLFRRKRIVRSLLWWIAYVVCIAFLPNAPYMLTDIIHLMDAIRDGYSVWVLTIIFVPLHAFAMLAGFEAYVVSVMNQSHYLVKEGAKQYVTLSELLIHALAAVGIYLGRFLRFNSWDLVTSPDTVLLRTLDTLTSRRPIPVIFVTFVIITVAYWIAKQITIGLWLRIKQVRSGLDF